jgi:hypothetical protein
MDPGQQVALAALERCRVNLRAARIDAQTAHQRLTGVRSELADDLAARVADCLWFAQRLHFLLESDVRYESLRDRD